MDAICITIVIPIRAWARSSGSLVRLLDEQFWVARPEKYIYFPGVVAVAAVCDVCGKGPGFGYNVSHSHRRTKRRFNPNIQRVRTSVGGTSKRVNVCTSCLKAGKV